MNMKKSTGLILSLSEEDYAPLVTAEELGKSVSTHQTLQSELSESKRRVDLLEATEASSSSSKSSIPHEISAYSSNQTTGQQLSNGNAIQTGPQEMALNVRSGKASRNPGLPTGSAERKQVPLWSGLVKYFPDALAAVAAVSYQGSKQHHPEKALHWDRSKSTDHEDCLLRHQWESGTVDTDGHRHAAKVAWRALAILQLELEGSK